MSIMSNFPLCHVSRFFWILRSFMILNLMLTWRAVAYFIYLSPCEAFLKHNIWQYMWRWTCNRTECSVTTGCAIKHSLVSKESRNHQCSFHFTQQFEHYDISSVCSLSNLSDLGEYGWVVFLLLKLLCLSVWFLPIHTIFMFVYFVCTDHTESCHVKYMFSLSFQHRQLM